MPAGSKTRKWAAGSLLGVVLLAGGAYAYMQLVKAGVLRYNRFDRRERGSLAVGDTAPDLALALYEGGSVQLSSLWRTKPVVLVFGSCT